CTHRAPRSPHGVFAQSRTAVVLHVSAPSGVEASAGKNPRSKSRSRFLPPTFPARCNTGVWDGDHRFGRHVVEKHFTHKRHIHVRCRKYCCW
ncbi:unnamed protein product, partial [Ectocarpus sp. 13 AM-2016]